MNPKTIAVLCMSLLSGVGVAQQSAITQTGEEVVLYSNGTWAFVDKDSLKLEEIPFNEGVFSKSKKASFLLKSKRIGIGCWIDPKKWKFRNAEDHAAAEYDLDHINGSLYGMVITENLDITKESLANIAIDNARDAAPDIKVTTREYRIVNGTKVLMMRMTGTISDIRFSYFGYYADAGKGATQFLVYSSEAFLEENVNDVEELLNGFVEINE